MRWPGHRLALGFFAAVLVVWLIVMAVLMRQAALPEDASGTMLVVFEPSIESQDAFARIVSAGARPIRATAFDFIWVVDGDESGLAGRLKQQGALGSYRNLPINPSIAGCFALVDAKAESLF